MKNTKIFSGLGNIIVLVSVFWGPFFSMAYAAPPPQKLPLVVMAAKKLGIKACLPAITQAAEANSSGAVEQNIVVDWNRKTPNDAPFFSMTALGAGDHRAILSITAIPLPHKNCALMVQRVFSSLDSCSLIAQRDLTAYVGGQLIGGVLIYNNPARPEETYTLMQNKNNCTVVFRNDIPKWMPER